jgi:hypothetical protein
MRLLICFLAVMRCACVSFAAFLVHNFRARYIRIGCYAFILGGGREGRVGALLRAFRVRGGACFAAVQYLDEMRRFLAAE